MFKQDEQGNFVVNDEQIEVLKRQEEEEAARLAAEEEAARVAAEEEAARIAAEEAAARKAEAAQKATEEEAAMKAAEDEAARKLAEATQAEEVAVAAEEAEKNAAVEAAAAQVVAEEAEKKAVAEEAIRQELRAKIIREVEEEKAAADRALEEHLVRVESSRGAMLAEERRKVEARKSRPWFAGKPAAMVHEEIMVKQARGAAAKKALKAASRAQPPMGKYPAWFTRSAPSRFTPAPASVTAEELAALQAASSSASFLSTPSEPPAQPAPRGGLSESEDYKSPSSRVGPSKPREPAIDESKPTAPKFGEPTAFTKADQLRAELADMQSGHSAGSVDLDRIQPDVNLDTILAQYRVGVQEPWRTAKPSSQYRVGAPSQNWLVGGQNFFSPGAQAAPGNAPPAAGQPVAESVQTVRKPWTLERPPYLVPDRHVAHKCRSGYDMGHPVITDPRQLYIQEWSGTERSPYAPVVAAQAYDYPSYSYVKEAHPVYRM